MPQLHSLIHEGQIIILTIQFTPCNVTNRQSYQLNEEYMTLCECQFLDPA